jgi:glycolate oxidase FAD binding subunit
VTGVESQRDGEVLRPSTREEAAAALKGAAADGARVRPVGGATKLGWGTPVDGPRLDLSLAGLDRIVEHNEGDLTAVLEAGVPLGRAQERFAEAGQMMALDPHLGTGGAATIGGIMATGDSGPLRHRYGGPRDLIIGVQVAMSDGVVARAGGKVIKNVAGYDLAKLFTGSFGTLGIVLEVSVRLHPLAARTATAVGEAAGPDLVARAAADMAHARMEMECLDVRWEGGHGRVLARFGGTTGDAQAEAARDRLAAAGMDAEVVVEDDELWEGQRAGQRSEAGTVVRVSGVQSRLAHLLHVADELGASVVGRAALGISWVALEEGDPVAGVTRLREELAPHPCVVQDAPAEVRAVLDPWGSSEGAPIELLQRLKARFDPQGACNPGVYVGGI